MHNCMQPNVLVLQQPNVLAFSLQQPSVLACAAAAAAAAGSDSLRHISSGGRGGRPAPLDEYTAVCSLD